MAIFATSAVPVPHLYLRPASMNSEAPATRARSTALRLEEPDTSNVPARAFAGAATANMFGRFRRPLKTRFHHAFSFCSYPLK
jgi:hypothetical protein